MSVVIRCPSCGTTQASPGECDACHEAQVRYFCTNHTPGVWLDGRTCPQCGAGFGDPLRRPPAPPARAEARTPALGATRPASPSARSPSHRITPEAEAETETEAAATLAPWQQLLATALRARYLARGTAETSRTSERGTGGCLRRVVLLLLLLFLALVVVVVMFGRALLQGLQPY